MPLTAESAARKDRTQPSGNSMQHRHFSEIARIIREMPTNAEVRMSKDDAERIAEYFAIHLRHTNPRFDRKRFLAACKA